MKRILMTGCLAAACSFAAAAAAPADELEGLLGRLRRAEAMAGGAVKNDSVASVCADLSGYYNYISAARRASTPSAGWLCCRTRRRSSTPRC